METVKRQQPLELRGGKFYRGGQPVPVEFGNLEQIRLMNEQLRAIHEEEAEGIPVEPNFTVTIEADINFNCLCGKQVWIHASPDDEDDYNCFVGEGKTCQCGKRWEVRKDDSGELRVKQISKHTPAK